MILATSDHRDETILPRMATCILKINARFLEFGLYDTALTFRKRVELLAQNLTARATASFRIYQFCNKFSVCPYRAHTAFTYISPGENLRVRSIYNSPYPE